MYKNLRWKFLVILAVTALAVWAFIAAVEEDQARSRPAGRRAPRPAGADRRRAAARNRDVGRAAARGGSRRRASRSTASRPDQPDAVHGRRRAAGRRLSSSGRWPISRSATSFDRDSGVGGIYTFTMKPNIARAPPRRGGRRRRFRRSSGASTSSASPSRSSRPTASAGDQIIVAAAGRRRTSTRAKNDHQQHRAARAQARRRRPGAGSGDAARRRTTARCRADMEVVPGVVRRRAAMPTRVLPGAQGAGDHRPRPAERARRRSTSTTCRRSASR